MFPEEIETDRLVLERCCHENLDVLELYRVCSDADWQEDMAAVTRYMPWEPHETVAESAEFIDDAEKRWEERESADYVIRPADGQEGAGVFAGVGSLHLDWDRRTGRLGTWLRKRFWGRGYSGERAAALMDLAFERLDLELVAVTHHVENEQSERAVEKYIETYGGRREGRLRNWIPYGDEVADEIRYSVSREEYRAATR
ncbi:N-acetyltransferase [Halobacteriales archaeon QS_4_69_34]|nr:MAG: N-acetyltransferase [Halobacteriales archaeon QS_4_69_34]